MTPGDPSPVDVLASLPDLIALVDRRTLSVVATNRGRAGGDALVGASLTNLFPDADDEALEDLFERAEDGFGLATTLWFRGAVLSVHLRASVPDERGHALLVIRDLGTRDEVASDVAPPPAAEAPPPASTGAAATRLEDVERAHILGTLRKVGENRTRAAELLGISRSTLKRKLAAHKRGE